ncbi:MAG: hypothetical protein IJE68_06140 [Clostridia bacterium]|nr:hypothetical protein [Clostridia bacterium]
MKTKITVFLVIVISIMLVGTINVKANNDFAHSAEKLAEILDATHNANVVTLQRDVDLIGGEYGEPMMLDINADNIILDLNGFSLSGAEMLIFSQLHIKNGTINNVHISYWDTLTIENAIVRRIKWSSRIFYKY